MTSSGPCGRQEDAKRKAGLHKNADRGDSNENDQPETAELLLSSASLDCPSPGVVVAVYAFLPASTAAETFLRAWPLLYALARRSLPPGNDPLHSLLAPLYVVAELVLAGIDIGVDWAAASSTFASGTLRVRARSQPGFPVSLFPPGERRAHRWPRQFPVRPETNRNHFRRYRSCSSSVMDFPFCAELVFNILRHASRRV